MKSFSWICPEHLGDVPKIEIHPLVFDPRVDGPCIWEVSRGLYIGFFSDTAGWKQSLTQINQVVAPTIVDDPNRHFFGYPKPAILSPPNGDFVGGKFFSPENTRKFRLFQNFARIFSRFTAFMTHSRHVTWPFSKLPTSTGCWWMCCWCANFWWFIQ